MLVKAILTIGGLIFFSLIFVFAYMKNGAEESSAAGAETGNSARTPAPNAAPAAPLPELKKPRLVVKKSERKLELFDGDKLIRTYRVGLGFAPAGDKQIEGDGKTPEGEFYIFTKNDRSRFYLSLGISYPSAEDAERGFRDNLISKDERDEIVEAIRDKKTPPQKTRLGGEVYIHGNGSASDWTWGCIALEDAEMKQLFDAVPIGAAVRIEP